jgi:predicted RNA-binding protein with PIN domain
VAEPQPSIAQLRPALELAWAVARIRSQERPPIPIPGRMRPLVRAAKLPDRMLSTIRNVVEDDSEFRSQVAQVADQEMLGRLASLWLVRPDGWEEELGGLLEQHEGDQRRLDEQKDGRLAQERLASLKRDLARAEAEVQVLRKANGESSAALAAQQQAARRAEARRRDLADLLQTRESDMQILVARIEHLEASVDELSGRLEQSKLNEATATAARDAALTGALRSADQLDDASGRIERLQLETKAERDAAADALTRAAMAGRDVDQALRDAAAALGLAADITSPSAPVSSRPVEPVTDDHGLRPRGPPVSKPPSRRSRAPVRLPPGVFDHDPDAADHLVRTKGMTLVVDGYNVSISSWPDRELSDQRWRLVHALAELVARFDITVRLFFDGVEDGGRLQLPNVARRRMTVEFSPSDVEADERIISLVGGLESSRPVTVATNDGRVRAEVARRGANVISVEQLLAVVRRLPDPGST